jgi:DNA-binding transcriptional MocR family regulator
MQHTYQRIARSLQKSIEAGHLTPGEKLPSVRAYAQTMGVSVSTVTRCYRHLETSGHVVARLKSGMYVADWPMAKSMQRQRLDNTPSKTPPLEIQKLASLQDRLTQLHSLTAQPMRFALHLANADAQWYPNEALARMGQRLLRSQPQLLGTYPTGTGLLALKQALIRHLASSGVDLEPDDLLITQGSTEAMQLALRAVTQPGDTVIVESPVYFGLLQMLEALSLKALEVPSPAHCNGISLEALEYALEHNSSVKAIVLMPRFQNPLGTAMSLTAKRQLMKIISAYPVTLIEDDVFGDFSAAVEQPQPLKAWDRMGQIIYCASASKSIAPGLRIGWIAAGRHQQRINSLKLSSSLSTPIFEQAVLAEYLNSNALPVHMRTLRQRLKTCVQPAQDAIRRYFPKGTKITCPDGGWWLWLELPEPFDAMALLRSCVSHGITFAPGALFSGSAKFHHCLRLNIGRRWDRDMDSCLKTIGTLACAQYQNTHQ